jgi:hypothetical protein
VLALFLLLPLSGAVSVSALPPSGLVLVSAFDHYLVSALFLLAHIQVACLSLSAIWCCLFSLSAVSSPLLWVLWEPKCIASSLRHPR